ncbi:MAG: glycosyl hydrolase [Verrucomicrobiales bacterium]|nr:glycosyl hydrolase [Verrucomicrobiales bacterium]
MIPVKVQELRVYTVDRRVGLRSLILKLTAARSLCTHIIVLGLVWAPARATGEFISRSQVQWPALTNTMKPWTYWWWPGSAVDPTNITRELERYHNAGLGGVHIIPIYGAKGAEHRYIQYLSPKWLQMLSYTVTEARRLGMDVDMTLGTGWCFGGPRVTDLEANALVVVRTNVVMAGGSLGEKFDPAKTQALVAFSDSGDSIELTERIRPDGTVDWVAPGSGAWTVIAVSQRPSGQKVKRAAPGGEGHMLNLFYPEAVRRFLEWFEDVFASYSGPKPRAVYHDSYEYRCDWSPDLFSQFERRRGYKLQMHLREFFSDNTSDVVARLKCDYRETVSDLIYENLAGLWTPWAHRHGFITRNEAHGSPGNLLDFYAAADIPETEFFRFDRNILIAKFASSAAHVTGKRLVSSESATWLAEHFNETLGALKILMDEFFVSGINHVFYHGTCYSPDDAPWPGWLFYASTQMNPRNSIWRDVPTLNAYITRCQSILQTTQPDHDILLYWPIYDLWHNPTGTVQQLTVHNTAWFTNQSIGRLAIWLWARGFMFDYVSDRQLALAKAVRGQIEMPGGTYRTVLVPQCTHVPLGTMEKLVALAQNGCTIIFENSLPADVPGLDRLEERRSALRKLIEPLRLRPVGHAYLRRAHVGAGQFFVGDVEAALQETRIERESLADKPGFIFIRRKAGPDRIYFIANHGTQAFSGWITLATKARVAALMDPMTGRIGRAAARRAEDGGLDVYIQLQPAESVFVCATQKPLGGTPPWRYLELSGRPIEITGTWRVEFIAGGPELPQSFKATELCSWTALSDTNAHRFAGTALYRITFDRPAQPAEAWMLDLGRVCDSARVRLNGRELGTLINAPFRLVLENLAPTNNQLEIEVTNLSANRIRDLDRRGVQWKIFHDINFVNVHYRPFDASDWPLRDSGLMGPVTISPVKSFWPGRR